MIEPSAYASVMPSAGIIRYYLHLLEDGFLSCHVIDQGLPELWVARRLIERWLTTFRKRLTECSRSGGRSMPLDRANMDMRLHVAPV